MTVYTVLAPKVRDGDTLPDPMDVVFVKEGFSWPALFVAGPWLIFRRMWLVLAGYIVLALGLSIITAPLGRAFPGDVLVLIHLLFALEANELRRWTLTHHGYRLIGVVQGRGIEEAEIRYFAAAEDAGAMPVPPVPPTPPAPPRPLPAMQPSAEAGDVVGLFPAPGGVS
jgi:hypothetical protein